MAHSLRLRVPKWILSWTLLLTDALAGAAAFYFVFLPYYSNLELPAVSQFQDFIFITAGWGFLFFVLGLFKASSDVSRFGEIQTGVLASFAVTVLGIFLNAVNFLYLPVEPTLILNYWLAFICCFSITRFLTRSFQKWLIRKGIGVEKTIIVGCNPRGKKVEEDLKKHPDFGYDLVGFVKIKEDAETKLENFSPVLGDEMNLKDLIIDHQVSQVVLAPEESDHTRLMSLLTLANGAPTSIKIVPDLYEVISGMARTQQLVGLPLIKVTPELDTLYNRTFKRILDLSLAIPLLIICLPLWAIIAALIKLDSRGPVFYRQERSGKGQKRFKIIKFRSMVKNAESWTGPVWASEEDDRITKVGRWLRRFRLDETPQIVNVIRGEMSLVGPRPERPSIIDNLIHEYPFYYRRHAVRPGISGWAQIKHPYDQRIEDVRQKLKYDFYYIESLSLNLDLKILLNTVWVMLSGKGR